MRSRHSGSRSDSAALLLIAVLFVSPVAALLATVSLIPRADDAIVPSERPTYLSVEKTTFLDATAVDLSLDWVDGADLLAPAWSGTVTAVAVQAGDQLANGAKMLSIDGVWRIAAHTPSPFYRPVSKQSDPQEVLALNGFLSTLGLPHGEATWTRDTLVGVQQLAASLGVAQVKELTAFDPAWAVWMPTPAMIVGEVGVTPGSLAPGVGLPLLSTPPRLASVDVSSAAPAGLPAAEEAAEWVLRVEDTSVTFAGAQILDPDALAALEAELRATQPDELTAEVERREGIVGWQVPIESVVVDVNGDTCVIRKSAKGRDESVTVIVARGGTGVARVSGGLRVTDEVLVNPVESLKSTRCN